jgi:hypothetical protein
MCLRTASPGWAAVEVALDAYRWSPALMLSVSVRPAQLLALGGRQHHAQVYAAALHDGDERDAGQIDCDDAGLMAPGAR